jgi:hypothetical protein
LLVADDGVRNRLAHLGSRLREGVGAKIDHQLILPLSTGHPAG